MANRDIEVTADSLEEARAKIQREIQRQVSQVPHPRGWVWVVVDERIISDGRPQEVIRVAETAAEALKRARQKVPRDGRVIEERPCEAQMVTLTVEVSAEQQIPEEVERRHPRGEIAATRLVTAPRRGFLGIGKREAAFEVDVFCPAHACIIWKPQARIQATIGNKPRYDLYEGSGICDVCNRTLSAGKAYKVPVRTFYKSPAYRRHCEPLARTMGVNIAEFMTSLRSVDKTTHSAVCGSCIHLF